MNRTSAVNPKQRGDRQGAVVGLLLIGLVFLTGFFALCLNVVRLQNVQSQLQTACRSAALAGAAELLDEGVLYGRQDAAEAGLMAREAARFFASRNTVDGHPIQLDRNVANDPEGDVVVGWVDPTGPVGQVVQTTSATELEPNTVRVTMHIGKNVADEMTLWLGAMVGVKSFDVGARAKATIDRRVSGFRPRPGVRVPLAPFVAEYETWIAEAQKAANDDGNDEYSVDPKTGAVVAGSDGIAEMKLICGPPLAKKTEVKTPEATEVVAAAETVATAEAPETEQPDDATTTVTSSATIACAPLVLLNPEGGSPFPDAVRCREGLSADDLGLYGRELVLEAGMRTVFVDESMSNDLVYAMMDIVGQPRAWALGERDSESSDEWTVVGFAAARVVAVRAVEDSENNEWEIIIQPTTLVCSQAVASPDMNPNPWLAKLELTQ